MPNFAVILPAAGAATRFGPHANKLFALLRDGLPVIACTLERFLSRPDIGLVIVATPAGGFRSSDDHPALRRALEEPRVRLCEGGASRAHSVRKALAEVPPEVEWVAVHDAARPLVTAALIERTVEAASRYGAAVPALGIIPTVKQADGPLPAKVRRTVPRHTLWAVQTPQVMRRAALEAAFAACPVPLEQVTDEAQLLELAGQDVWLVQGDERNLKITTPDDLHAARAYFDQAGEAAR